MKNNILIEEKNLSGRSNEFKNELVDILQGKK